MKSASITVSIVIHKTSRIQLEKVLSCVLSCKNILHTVFVIDNSPDDRLRTIEKIDSRIRYIYSENLGYGAGHNIALHEAIDSGVDFHAVINPDVFFESDVLPCLSDYMKEKEDVVCMMPKVKSPDGSVQHLCKLLPNPFDLILRRFLPNIALFRKIDDHYTLLESGYDTPLNPPSLSGCFMFLRLETLKKNNIFFDDSFFMYLEDFDLIRRLHRKGKTVYYPDVFITHEHERASYKDFHLLRVHIRSAIHYFNKYGWFFDRERKKMNRSILSEIKKSHLPPPLPLILYKKTGRRCIGFSFGGRLCTA